MCRLIPSEPRRRDHRAHALWYKQDMRDECFKPSTLGRRSWLAALVLLAGGLGSLACQDTGKVSAEKAKAHAKFLLDAANQDVQELRQGMPKGAKYLESVFKEGVPDGQTAKEALDKARNKVQDLRVAKSTFFALVGKDGTVIRNDQDQDLMAGKNMFSAFEDLKGVLSGKTVETRGTMKEAAGVRGKPDAQWVIGVPIEVEGKVVAAYVSGWSWSAYAYRLETSLRSDILAHTEAGGKVPLTYVYVLVSGRAYGAPISPAVNGDAIVKQKPLAHASAKAPFATSLEIEGRVFGLAVVPFEKVGDGTGIAVLRSET